MNIEKRPERLLRLSQIVGPVERRIPVSKSQWWAKVKTGEFPKPRKLSARCTVWLESEVDALIAKLGQGVGDDE